MIRRTAFTVGATALVVLGVAVAFAWLRPSAPMSHEQQAAQLDAQLRCPDCQGLSVAESTTSAAGAIRAEVARRLAAGQTADEVRGYFVSRYGDWILLEPASVAWWLLPFLLVLLGAAGLVAWLWAGRRERDVPTAAPTRSEPDAAKRIRDEVEALDA